MPGLGVKNVYKVSFVPIVRGLKRPSYFNFTDNVNKGRRRASRRLAILQAGASVTLTMNERSRVIQMTFDGVDR